MHHRRQWKRLLEKVKRHTGRTFSISLPPRPFVKRPRIWTGTAKPSDADAHGRWSGGDGGLGQGPTLAENVLSADSTTGRGGYWAPRITTVGTARRKRNFSSFGSSEEKDSGRTGRITATGLAKPVALCIGYSQGYLYGMYRSGTSSLPMEDVPNRCSEEAGQE